MPTYIVNTSPNRLSMGVKQSIVDALTRIHSEEGGGVPQYLVQVMFNEVLPENRYINKKQVPNDQVWIRGDIRGGRTDAQKTAMAERMMLETAEAIGIDRSYVWVYISDLEKAAEFGQVLPAPGEEEAWIAKIPQEVKDRYGMHG